MSTFSSLRIAHIPEEEESGRFLLNTAPLIMSNISISAHCYRTTTCKTKSALHSGCRVGIWFVLRVVVAASRMEGREERTRTTSC